MPCSSHRVSNRNWCRTKWKPELAIGEWASRCTPKMLKRFGSYFHENQGRYVAPNKPIKKRILPSVEIEVLESVFNHRRKSRRKATLEEALAVDGKVFQGARDDDNQPLTWLSAVHASATADKCKNQRFALY